MTDKTQPTSNEGKPKFHVTARAAIGMDSIDCIVIYAALDYDRSNARHLKRAAAFANAVLRTVSVEGLPFEWVTADSKPGEIASAFVSWQALDPNTISVWEDALYRADQPPNAGE